MSAYQLEDERFQELANWLYASAISRQYCFSFIIKTFIGFVLDTSKNYYSSTEQIKESVRKTIRNLYNLNRLSLVTRYGDLYDIKDEKQFIPISSILIKDDNAIELLKSLRYQCTEYMTSDTSLYIKLNHFIGELCEAYFDRTKSHEV